MGNANTEPTPPENLPEGLIQQIKTLDLSELKSLQSYTEQRINTFRTPLEEEIEADAAGEVLDIENHGAYAIVRMHPPDPNGDGVDTEITPLYHVRREKRLDGTESLHWAYLGDVDSAAQSRCESCGRTLDDDFATCPYCGSDEVDHAVSEE